MQNFSQSEQNVTNFQNSRGEMYFHVNAIFTNLQKVLTTWKNLVVEIILLETFKCWTNTFREIILKIFIQFILYLT